MFSNTEVMYKKEENNYHPGNRCSLFMNNLTIKDVLYNLRASLPGLLTNNARAYVARGMRKRLQA